MRRFVERPVTHVETSSNPGPGTRARIEPERSRQCRRLVREAAHVPQLGPCRRADPKGVVAGDAAGQPGSIARRLWARAHTRPANQCLPRSGRCRALTHRKPVVDCFKAKHMSLRRARVARSAGNRAADDETRPRPFGLDAKSCNCCCGDIYVASLALASSKRDAVINGERPPWLPSALPHPGRHSGAGRRGGRNPESIATTFAAQITSGEYGFRAPARGPCGPSLRPRNDRPWTVWKGTSSKRDDVIFEKERHL